MEHVSGSPRALVLGGYNVGFSVVRSLARAGFSIILITTGGEDFPRHSRFVGSHFHVPRESLVPFLLEHGERWKGCSLLPTSDSLLEMLLDSVDQLEKWYECPLPRADLYHLFQNKARCYDYLQSLEVPQPMAHLPTTLRELREVAPLMTYPCLLKPVSGHRFFGRFRRKMWRVSDPGQLEARWREAESAGLPCLVTEWIGGRDTDFYSYVCYRSDAGVQAEVFTQKLRQHPPGIGVGRVVRTVAPVEEIRELSCRILDASGYRGFADFEYKRDPEDGRYKFIEVNLRLVLQDVMFTESGVNFAAMLAGREVANAPLLGDPDVYWHYAAADIVDSLRYPRSLDTLNPVKWAAPYFAPRSVAHIPFREDPKLWWAKTWGSLMKIVKRFLAPR